MYDVTPGRATQHGNKKADVRDIYFENRFNGVALHREASGLRVVATMNYSGIFKPLERTDVLFGPGAFADEIVLEFFVILGQLLRDGVETASDKWLVIIVGIFHHIVLVFLQDTAKNRIHLAHIARLQQFVHGGRKASDCHIAVQQVFHGDMNSLRDWRLFGHAVFQKGDDLIGNAVGP